MKSIPKPLKMLLKNIEKIKFTGKKFKDKKYYKHTGHPGGIKEITPLRLKEKNKSSEILKLAVKRMLPGGPLAKKQLTKLKIYNDEKLLFQENAKCSLYGTSDDVEALAYDDTTDVLHVGTSGGRSDFRGLKRINNTTTAVTTAISASNGFVAEQ